MYNGRCYSLCGDLEIVHVRDEDTWLALAAYISVAITPVEYMDEHADSLKPIRQAIVPVKLISPFPQYDLSTTGVVGTFDGSVKIKERIGTYGVILWSLPTWQILYVERGTIANATVNLTEYQGCLTVLIFQP